MKNLIAEIAEKIGEKEAAEIRLLLWYSVSLSLITPALILGIIVIILDL